MITYEECEMQVWVPAEQRYRVPQVQLITPVSTLLLKVTQTRRNIMFLLLSGSPFLFMILAVSYRKYRKNWLLKNYYSRKWIWPVSLLASQGQTTLSIERKPLGLLIAWLLFFFFFSVKWKQKLRKVTESEYKKMYKCIMLPRHTQILFSSMFSPWPCK